MFNGLTHFLVCNDLVGGREDDSAPAFDESVGFCHDFPNFALQFLLSSQKAIPEIIANGAFLQQVLEGRFVFTDTKGTSDVRYCSPDESCFENSFVGWGV